MFGDRHYSFAALVGRTSFIGLTFLRPKGMIAASALGRYFKLALVCMVLKVFAISGTDSDAGRIVEGDVYDIFIKFKCLFIKRLE